MKEIVTVTGPIAPEELGFCQCHEHIAMSKGKSWYLNPALRIDDMAKSLEEVRRYKSCGGDSFIDAQPCGCNRMAEELRKLSVKSGVHIIASPDFTNYVSTLTATGYIPSPKLSWKKFLSGSLPQECIQMLTVHILRYSPA